jgi:hydroxymethylglutaryl-CoA lyase
MIDIVEVSPRDGLQSDALTITTEAKLGLIERLIAAGARRIEATSFVNPKRVPQMADADELMARLPRPAGVSYSGLVLNRRGLDRALAAGVDEVNFVVVATDTFNRRNQGTETAETLAVWAEVARAARRAGRKVSAVIGAAFGCPFEGEVPVARLVEVAKRVADAAPDEISLADTIGVAAPSDVTERFVAVAAAAQGIRLRGHFHNTRNTGLANAYAALQVGVSALDASLGGIGGCPFAPAATGNIPTEDLCYMLSRMGVPTGFDLTRLIDAARWLETELGRPMPAMLGKAGLFPRESAAV